MHVTLKYIIAYFENRLAEHQENSEVSFHACSVMLQAVMTDYDMQGALLE